MRSEPPDIGDRVRAAEVVVAAALAAFHTQQWEALAALNDADSVEKLMATYLEGKARRLPPPPSPSWEEEDSQFEELREMLEAAYELPVTFHELAGVETLEEAQALSSAEFMMRWAQARHPAHEAMHGLGDASRAVSERVVVGSVALLPDTALVVVRSVNDSWSVPLAALGYIVVLGNGCGEWKLDAASQWLGLADIIIR